MRWAVGAVAAVTLVPVFGQFSINFAEERGIIEAPTSRAHQAMIWLASLADLPSFKFVAGLILGLALGLWIDRVLREREGRQALSKPLRTLRQRARFTASCRPVVLRHRH